MGVGRGRLGRRVAQALYDPPATPPVRTREPIRADDTPRRLARRTLTSYPGRLVWASGFGIAHQACEALVPVVVGICIDRAIATSDAGELVMWIGVLAVVFLALSLSYRTGSRTGWLVHHQVQHDLRMTLTDRLLAPDAPRPRRMIGALLSVATTDVGILARGIGAVTYVPGMLVGIVVSAVALLLISVPLGLAVLVGSALVLIIGEVGGGRLRGRVHEQQERAATASATATDLVHGLPVIQGVGAQHPATQRYLRVSREALTARVATVRSSAATEATLDIVGTLFVVAVALAGALLAVRGDISVGQLITVVMLAQFVMEPVGGVGHAVAYFWTPAVAAAGRILDLWRDTEPTPRPTAPELPLGTGLLLEHPRADLRIPGGAHAVIRCDTASADQLIAALRGEVAGASVCPDTESDDDWSQAHALVDLPSTLRRGHVLLAPHDAYLFAGSIRENIALTDSGAGHGREPETDSWLRTVVIASATDDVESTRPEGLNAQVGDGGSRLSGGQRQRVALARALYADPAVLVLVDPTSGLDSITEQRTARAALELREGRTTVVLTTSPAWARHADLVLDWQGQAPLSQNAPTTHSAEAQVPS